MKELFSSSSSKGEPFTAASAPTPAPDSVKLVTSLVDTKPPEPRSRRKTAPLPVTIVASPPPPLLPPPTLPRQVPDVGGTYAAKLPAPCPIQIPAVSPGHELGRPPVHRSKSTAVSRLWSIPLAL